MLLFVVVVFTLFTQHLSLNSTMSDTSFAAIIQTCVPLNFIDDKWAEESLSDDEIDLPKGVDFTSEEHVEGGAVGDDDEEEECTGEDVWKEEGLDRFLKDPF